MIDLDPDAAEGTHAGSEQNAEAERSSVSGDFVSQQKEADKGGAGGGSGEGGTGCRA
jgi:hypothetical protein